MNENNIILNLPFDEQNGSTMVYDHSNSRTDGFVRGAKFVEGIDCGAIEFSGNDICSISTRSFNIDNDFTLLFWAKMKKIENETQQNISWLLTFIDDTTIGTQMTVAPDEWNSIALVKQGNTYKFYLNTQLQEDITKDGYIRKIELFQDSSTSRYGFGCLDSFRIYNIPLTQSEIIMALAINHSSDVIYLIDGIDFKDFGVFVSDSEGILNRPKLKQQESQSWDNYHGATVDLEHKFYESREITLSCFIKANDRHDFANKIIAFEDAFKKQGTQRLTINALPTKPLIYEVYCKDEITVSKKWNSALMVGTFKLKLVEPEPVKRLLKHIYSSDYQNRSLVLITSQKLLNIYWGDGSADFDLSGNEKIISHKYKKKGEYYPLITGDIDDITLFATNDIVIWNKF
ncbi:MAG: LamG domain-containing protein [Prevotellaceae bacterium]|jgi:hypothetical protein|nr:LamG domain-containing protein [Prevotellaceae bacterium]